jgi:L-iditol 2-dehydrogenase
VTHVADDVATMRAVFLTAPGSIELREVPVPRAAAGEVLVRVEAALTCGTDLKTWQRGHARLAVPAPFGHEASGRVAVCGAGVTGFAEGDAVMWAPTAPCGACRFCRRGRENLCADAVGRMVLGAYADYVLLPAHIVARHLFRRPAGLAAGHAALLEPLACVLHGASRVSLADAERVAIIGDGTIALLFARVAALRGAPDVLVLGRHEARLAVARQFGATVLLTQDDEQTRELAGAADLVIECAGSPASWRLASDLTRAGGTALLFGGCAAGAHVTLDAAHLHYDEVDHIGAFHYTPRAVTEALDMLSDGLINAGALLTHSMPLDRIEDAFGLMAARAALRVELLP